MAVTGINTSPSPDSSSPTTSTPAAPAPSTASTGNSPSTSNTTTSSAPVDSFQPSPELAASQARLPSVSTPANSTTSSSSGSDAASKIVASNQSQAALEQYPQGKILPFQYATGNGNTLTIDGTTHIKDPAAQDSQDNQSVLHNYFNDTPSSKQMVLLETGSVPKAGADTYKFGGGEFGQAADAARQHGAPIESANLPTADAAAGLQAKGASKDDINSFFSMRKFQGQDGNSFSAEQMYKTLSDTQKETGLPNADLQNVQNLQRQSQEHPEQADQLKPQLQQAQHQFTTGALAALNQRAQEASGQPLINAGSNGDYKVSSEASKNINTMNNPNLGGTAFNNIAQTESDLRNQHFLAVAKSKVDAGFSPILVAGAAHAVDLDPALSSLYNRTSAPATNPTSHWSDAMAAVQSLIASWRN